MTDLEQIPLSEELLGVMRRAADLSIENGEMFLTPRSLLLALLEDPGVGPAIAGVVVRDKLLAIPPAERPLDGMTRLKDDLPDGERPALVRYDTLAIKARQGKTSVWLNKESFTIFLEGAQRVETRYFPKHLALGIAAEAVRTPGILAAIRIEPGRLTDAIYKL